MAVFVGKVLELHLEPDGRRSPLIGCEPKAVPAAGQYVLAHAPADPDALLAEALFLQRRTEGGFLAAPPEDPFTQSWDLGAELELRGPHGHGFRMPGVVRNLALAALGSSFARLLPLLETTDSTAMFTDLPAHGLPSRVEVQPLGALPDAFGWADFLAMDLPLERLEPLRALLRGQAPPGQALVTAPMPCGGLADCGVCTLKGGRKPVLLCKDGPVCELGLLIGTL